MKRLAFLLSVAFFVCVAINLDLFAQTDDDYEWADANFGRAFDALFPIHNPQGYYFAYRSSLVLHANVPEYSFTIGYDRKPNGAAGLLDYLSAHVRIADTIPVYEQMRKMHLTRPSDDVQIIQGMLKIKTWDLTERMCPAIASQIRKIPKLQLGQLKLHTITLDGMAYEFHFQSGFGQMDFGLNDEKTPVVAWALETRRVLDTCIATTTQQHPSAGPRR